MLLIALVLIGSLVGSAIGSSLAGLPPVFNAASWVGFGPATLNLKFMIITLGFSMSIGPVTVLGFIAGYFAYRRL